MKLMKPALLALSIAVACIVLMAASGSFAQNEGQKNKEPINLQVVAQSSSGSNFVMGYLQTRKKIVTISRGPDGSVFTIKDANGKTLASNLNEKDFQEKYPALFNQVKYGLAGNDATLRLDHIQLRK